MEPGTIENLIDFALGNYGVFNFFPRDQIRACFESHQDTTVIIRDGEKIRAFLIWEYRGADAIEIISIAAIGSTIENINIFWDLWQVAEKLLPGKKIYWRTDKGRLREIKCQLQQQPRC